jgi:signal transduction histidine kinase
VEVSREQLAAVERAAWQGDVLDQMSEGVLVFDPTGRVVMANASAGRLLGIRALPEGVPLRVLAEVPRLRTTVVEALRSGEIIERELSVPRGPAEVLFVRATPLTVGVVLVLLDLTAMRKMEDRWKQFAGDAAHELRTPAAAVQSNLEALEMMTDALPESGRRFLAGAQRQALRMTGLVEKLMQLVRMDGHVMLDVVEVSLDGVAKSVVEEWRGVDAATAQRVVIQGDLGSVRGDEGAVAQVVSNLVTNALRYSAGAVTLSAFTDGYEQVLLVRDLGPGIPEAFREKVFDRFVRVDVGRARQLGGAGLGLSIVKDLVQAMGGSVALKPGEPHGTVAEVRLLAVGELP